MNRNALGLLDLTNPFHSYALEERPGSDIRVDTVTSRGLHRAIIAPCQAVLAFFA